jgi:hypothetical protein
VTAFGIVLSIVSAVGIVIVTWMLWWAAREDGRDQERRDTSLRRDR